MKYNRTRQAQSTSLLFGEEGWELGLSPRPRCSSGAPGTLWRGLGHSRGGPSGAQESGAWDLDLGLGVKGWVSMDVGGRRQEGSGEARRVSAWRGSARVQVGKLLGVTPGRRGGVRQRGAREAPRGVQAAGSFWGETGLHWDTEEQGHKLNVEGRQPGQSGRFLPLCSAVSTSEVMFSVEGKRRSKWPPLPSGAHLPWQRCDRSATGQHRSRAGTRPREASMGSAGDAGDPDGGGSWTRWWRRSRGTSGTGARGMHSRQGPGPDSTLESSRESLRNSLVSLFVVTVTACSAPSAPWMGSDRRQL